VSFVRLPALLRPVVRSVRPVSGSGAIQERPALRNGAGARAREIGFALRKALPLGAGAVPDPISARRGALAAERRPARVGLRQK